MSTTPCAARTAAVHRTIRYAEGGQLRGEQPHAQEEEPLGAAGGGGAQEAQRAAGGAGGGVEGGEVQQAARLAAALRLRREADELGRQDLALV